ncbi:MAG: hypothetical protein LBJ67_02875 [Planctomycetaceae bacterium]|jgi:hypothetical protein|nr:hypothetical protein [Planctomycetaceae bacterium]
MGIAGLPVFMPTYINGRIVIDDDCYIRANAVTIYATYVTGTISIYPLIKINKGSYPFQMTVPTSATTTTMSGYVDVPIENPDASVSLQQLSLRFSVSVLSHYLYHVSVSRLFVFDKIQVQFSVTGGAGTLSSLAFFDKIETRGTITNHPIRTDGLWGRVSTTYHKTLTIENIDSITEKEILALDNGVDYLAPSRAYAGDNVFTVQDKTLIISGFASHAWNAYQGNSIFDASIGLISRDPVFLVTHQDEIQLRHKQKILEANNVLVRHYDSGTGNNVIHANEGYFIIKTPGKNIGYKNDFFYVNPSSTPLFQLENFRNLFSITEIFYYQVFDVDVTDFTFVDFITLSDHPKSTCSFRCSFIKNVYNSLATIQDVYAYTSYDFNLSYLQPHDGNGFSSFYLYFFDRLYSSDTHFFMWNMQDKIEYDLGSTTNLDYSATASATSIVGPLDEWGLFDESIAEKESADIYYVFTYIIPVGHPGNAPYPDYNVTRRMEVGYLDVVIDPAGDAFFYMLGTNQPPEKCSTMYQKTAAVAALDMSLVSYDHDSHSFTYTYERPQEQYNLLKQDKASIDVTIQTIDDNDVNANGLLNHGYFLPYSGNNPSCTRTLELDGLLHRWVYDYQNENDLHGKHYETEWQQTFDNVENYLLKYPAKVAISRQTIEKIGVPDLENGQEYEMEIYLPDSAYSSDTDLSLFSADDRTIKFRLIFDSWIFNEEQNQVQS